MPKVVFLGAGSTVFAKNVMGDIICAPEIKDVELALFDIDPLRLEDSYAMLTHILGNSGRRDVKLVKYTDRRKALKGAGYAVNAIQVGGYKPGTVTDFEVPKKYGLRQTIADTLGIGGIFRGLRTIFVMEDIAREMEELCPGAVFLNYVNPMAIITGFMQRYTGVKTVGLCHSVQSCVPILFEQMKMTEYLEGCRYEIAGINHQAWLLSIKDKEGNDLYPEIKARSNDHEHYPHPFDLVRHEMMHRFGYYITESSPHSSEYFPYFIKSCYPELLKRFNIPLDEYIKSCENQIRDWEKMRGGLVTNTRLEHKRSHEYGAYMIEAMETDKPYRVHGNVVNKGHITNLPKNACVEIPCLVDRNGITPCYVGDLPEQCAALNRTNINPQLLTIEAAVTRKKEYIYMAAMLDPHTSAELSMDDIRNMCDDLIAAHGSWLPAYK